MKAVVWSRYGPPEVLQLRDLARPEPGDDELLIRVRATTVTAGDTELRRFAFRNILSLPIRLFFGILRPRGERVLGQELAGEVVDIGDSVDRFAVGDRVVAQTGLRFGGYAEYACLPQDAVAALIPDAVSFEEAAMLPTAGLYAHYFITSARLTPGQSALIIGAGGSIGTYTLQLAKRSGALVAAVDKATKEGLLRDLGVDDFIDYETEDFSCRRSEYDVIFDVVDKSSFPKAAAALTVGGVYLHTNPSVWESVKRRFYRAQGDKRAVFVRERESRANLARIARMLATGELKSVIDREYRLEDLVEAHTYAESGDKLGHIVVTVD